MQFKWTTTSQDVSAAIFFQMQLSFRLSGVPVPKKCFVQGPKFQSLVARLL